MNQRTEDGVAIVLSRSAVRRGKASSPSVEETVLRTKSDSEVVVSCPAHEPTHRGQGRGRVASECGKGKRGFEPEARRRMDPRQASTRKLEKSLSRYRGSHDLETTSGQYR